jgi:ABC-2 type transport system ATP-binding protein
MHEPSLLILDEPTRSLDPFAARDLRNLLRSWILAHKNRAILITSHDLQEIESVSDRIAIMGRGYVGACGTARELRQQLEAGETITIELRCPPNDHVQALLRNLEVTVEPSSEGAPPFLTFRHLPESNTLDTVMRLVLEADLGVKRVNALPIQLQDVIDRLEHERL